MWCRNRVKTGNLCFVDAAGVPTDLWTPANYSLQHHDVGGGGFIDVSFVLASLELVTLFTAAVKHVHLYINSLSPNAVPLKVPKHFLRYVCPFLSRYPLQISRKVCELAYSNLLIILLLTYSELTRVNLLIPLIWFGTRSTCICRLSASSLRRSSSQAVWKLGSLLASIPSWWPGAVAWHAASGWSQVCRRPKCRHLN
jgi:hypothetical protein